MGGGNGVGNFEDASAKHLLDRIGKEVHDQVKNEADGSSMGKASGGTNYIEELKGKLSFATLSGEETTGFSDTCRLVKEYYTKLINGGSGNSNRHPCGKNEEEVKRFSKERDAKYDEKKIGCSNNEGACAPYRRLSLCNKNMENMSTNNNDDKAKHNLLLDVCLAAKYEAESLINYKEQYEVEYPSDSGFTTCTMLARSFADIGDIVRGRDKYGGNSREKKQRQQLENKLKDIFSKIHNSLDNNIKSGYNDTTNYYQLREDWWTANRETVWEALTCNDDNKLGGASYFRATCNDTGQGPSVARDKCRCEKKTGENGDQVPTYFDYVPQFLRWFEEWAEDFCRKKKHKLKDVKRNCRETDSSGQPRYCSRNGYDCEKTIRNIELLRMGKGCTDCFFACHSYESWIENQRKQFLKQKKKYEEEIRKYQNGAPGAKRKKRDTTITDYDGYESKFYEQLKDVGYDKVRAFLEKLNDEDVCKKKVNDDDEKGARIDFAEDHGNNNNTENKETFYRTKYCQPCPHCGVKREGKEWIDKSKNDQCRIKLYGPKNDAEAPTIRILKSGDEEKEIKEKLNKFCDQTNGDTTNSVASGIGDRKNRDNNDDSLYEEWKCYEVNQLEKVGDGDEDPDYDNDVKNGGGLCILKKEKKGVDETNSKNEPKEIQKTFNDFFNFWMAHMLKDSIYWRKEKIKSCINNKNTCGKNNCNVKCKCYENWVKKKKTEWKQIKKDYEKVDFNGTPPYMILEYNLKNEYFPKIKESYKEVKSVQEIEDIIGKEPQNFTEDNNSIDILLDHEEEEAEQCKNCKQEENRESPARNLEPLPDTRAPDVDNADEGSDDSEGEEEEEIIDEVLEEGEEEAEESSITEEKGPPKVEGDPPCDIVKQLFQNPKNLQDACTLKYGKNAPSSWKCVSSGSNTGSTSTGESSVGERGSETGERGATVNRHRRSADQPRGSLTTSSDSNQGGICIPPRRRKLYIKKIEEWAETQLKTQVEGQEGGTSGEANGETTPATSQSPNSDLLTAFVESAAIETFFLWHNYKERWRLRKEAKDREKGLLPGLPNSLSSLVPPSSEDDDPNPEKQLKDGKIPEEFLRQMFYTIADYKDILFSGSNVNSGSEKDGDGSNNNDRNIVLEAGGDKASMEKIQEELKKFFSKSGRGPSKPGPQNSDKTPQQTWWENNAEHIWNGMICALTYTEKNGGDGQKGVKPQITQDTTAYSQLLEKIKNEGEYTYGKVELEGAGATEAFGTDAGLGAASGTKLENFVSRPPYFRYLEEWGETFCVKRKDLLAKIREKCQGYNDSGDKRYCSGDGHICNEKELRHKDMFQSLDCPACHEQCMKYRKWIDMKFAEYHKQRDKYEEEKQKLNGNSESGRDGVNNNCCEKIKNYDSAASFLGSLKHCKNGEHNKDKDNEIDFTNIPQTFSRSTYCKTCPLNGVTCNHGRINGQDLCTPDNGKGNTWQSVFNGMRGNGVKTTENITVQLIDRRGPYMKEYMKENSQNSFEDSYLFKSVRTQQWECKFNKEKKMDVCKLNKFDANIDLNEYTTFKVFLLYWLEDFIDGYYILKKRKIIEQCKENGGETCNENFKNGCACVKVWVEQKEKEWNQIKDDFKNREPDDGSDTVVSRVRNFLEELIPRMDLTNGKEKISDLDAFLKAYACNCNDNSQNSEDGTQENNDLVLCLIKKLENEIKTQSCPSPNSGDTPAQCQKLAPSDENSAPDVGDVDDEEEQNPENTANMRPNICPAPPPTPPEPESKCDEEKKKEKEKVDQGESDPAASTPEPIPNSDDPNKEQTPVLKPEEEAPAPTPPAPAQPEPHPPRRNTQVEDPNEYKLRDVLLPSAFPLTVGVGFLALTYWFLKKKSKPSVDLLSVLEIPQNDYDIPTLKSKNRYIPYKSAQYRGKRYIYIEGDSSSDEKYAFMSDTTDVTSSESEYEELDINDIYVPGSPKYKTLIEVVLEPSKRDTQSDDTIPNSDIPSDNTPTNKFTEEEWNQLKKYFISNMLQNEPNDLPNILPDNVDNNTNPTPSHDNMDQKPFIMSIQDRNLYTGEEYSYDMINNIGNNDLYSGKNNLYSDIHTTSDNRGSYSDNHHPYSGIDLINDALSGNQPIDIYDEILKRKENELFGTNHTKHTTTNIVAKPARDDPIHNQIDLFHKWLDRHRNMCEKWDTNNKKEEILDKLKEEWNKDNNSGDIPSDSNRTLNSDVSIQINMNDPKPINQFTNMDTNPDNFIKDTILNDLEKHREPYFYDIYDDDITYFDIDNVKPPMGDIHIKEQTEMNALNNNKTNELLEKEYPISDMWNI
ncbi:erythrocyte membrane protein 1, PfEMP1 [Plasmodium reichenowi]|uniref:Erythrocyte membrane protein 1, PfEMP1 n=1 Tax=Plasmodium reichenowi TaxID=5854 RepID=A0A2P9DBN5_PLARE|nr:erythrocyte membrane protein 1, PfEMP1 [Plasmodium reichenowi]